jgi:hypothetical protein
MTVSAGDYEPGYERQVKVTIQTLVERLREAREGSAEHRMIERQLEGVRNESELARLIMEEYEISGTIYLS